MKACSACEEEIPDLAKFCHHCGAHQDDQNADVETLAQESEQNEPDPLFAELSRDFEKASNGCLKVSLLIFGGIVALSLIITALFGGFGGSGSGAGVAKRACHNTVESSLKSPSTARFSSSVSGHNTKEDNFLVEGTVDAQNSFGATVRNSFQCVVDTSGSRPRVTLNYLG
jgi:hypothetical protein